MEGRALVHTLWPSLLLALVFSQLIPLVGLTISVDNVHAQRAFEKAGFRIARQDDPPGSDIVISWSLSSTENSRSNSLKPNQSMKPTPSRNNPSVFATTPCRGLSPSR